MNQSYQEERDELAAQGRAFYERGWMLGTSGNLSIRLSATDAPLLMGVTASGVDKGQLTGDDILLVPNHSPHPGARRPSAETSIHEQVYAAIPEARAILHVHTVETTVASLRATKTTDVEFLHFSDLEMIKGFNIWEEGAIAKMPVFPNHGEVPRIAVEVGEFLKTQESIPAFLIRGHGITAWGASLAEARKHVEIAHFLCACLIQG